MAVCNEPACWPRNRARCRVIAGSAAYGSPISVRPVRRPRSGWSFGPHARQKTLDEHLPQRIAGQLGLDRAADHLRAATEHRHRRRVFAALAQQRFLGGSARMPESDALAGVEAVHALRQCGCHRIGECQVHVVAAEQDVLAHG